MKPFKQVDVFCSAPFSGNPVAVVFDADGMSVEEMQAIARWTNLSETTFVQSASDRKANYRIKIFTPGSELPFAGHPSVGAAYAAIENGTVPSDVKEIVQECGAGLIRLFVEGQGTSRQVFVTTPEPRIEQLSATDEEKLASIIDVPFGERGKPLIVDVGARWLTLELPSESALRSASPNLSEISRLSGSYSLAGLTVFALCDSGTYQVAVRSFAPSHGISEDPVCGSGNACVGAHLSCNGQLVAVGDQYTASQGREVGRDGLVSVRVAGNGKHISIGGRSRICVDGGIRLRD